MLAEADHRAVGNLRTYYQFPGEPSPTSDVPLSSPTSAEHVWGQNVSMRSAQHPSYRTFHDPTLTFPVRSPPLSLREMRASARGATRLVSSFVGKPPCLGRRAHLWHL